MTWRRILPWALLLFVLPLATVLAVETSADACIELPGAFSEGVTTQRTEILAGVLASHCEVGNGFGEIEERTIVNGSGIVAGLGLCAGAWLLGATIAGRIRRRSGLAGIGICAAAVAVAMAVFFV